MLLTLPLPFPSRPRQLIFSVREVSSRSDRRRLIHCAKKIYRNDRYWRPSSISDRAGALNPKKNLSLARFDLGLFMAESSAATDNETIGSIAAWVDSRHNEMAQPDVAFFGLLEMVNEPEVASQLLEAAEAWASEHSPGVSTLQGPMGLHPLQAPGILVDGFNLRPGALMPYNPPYYPESIEAAGYEPFQECLSYRVDLPALANPDHAPAALLRTEASRAREEHHLTVQEAEFGTRKTDGNHLVLDLAQLLRGCEASWDPGTGGAAPRSRTIRASDTTQGLGTLTSAELGSDMTWIRRTCGPATILVTVVGEDREPVAFGLGLPNARPPQPIELVTQLIAQWSRSRPKPSRKSRKAGIRLPAPIVRSECRDWGLEPLILYELLSLAAQQGYSQAEVSPVPANDLVARDRLAALGASPYKTYHIYERRL